MREGWEYKKLGDVCTIERGGSPRPIADYITESADGINWIKIGDAVEGSKYILFTKEKIRPEGIKKSRFVHKGDVILSNSMSFGKPYILGIDGCIHDGWLVLHDNNNTFSKDYLYYVLSSPIMYSKFTQLAVGGVVNNLNSNIVREVVVAIPPLSTQLSIVSELDKINELIRLKKEQLKDYDNLAQSIFYEMFGDPVENEKGWEVKKLIETVVLECTISYGIVQPGDGVEDGIPVVRPIDLTGTFVSTNNLKKTTEKISSSYSRTILTGKELLVCVRGTTGVCSLVTDELKGCNVTRGITPLLFNDNTDRWFMYYQFQMPQIKCIIADYTKGITLKQINMADFRKIPVILPPLPLQQLFAQRIELIEKQKAEVQRTIADLETLRASRMQDWFD